jgi:PAS domain S-box-containing protein
MKISEHAARTERLYGVRGEDIHRWIDEFFDLDGSDHSLRMGKNVDFDPYDHRRFRHCKEALSEAIKEFGDRYTSQQIKDVFDTHLRDDYDGYLPSRTDFENGTFTKKYHDVPQQAELGEVLDASELADYFSGLHDTQQESGSSLTSFSLRIVLPTITAIVLFVTAIIYVIVPLVEDSMLGQKRQMLRELTSTAVSIVESYVALEQRGMLSLEEAQRRAKTEIKAMRYGDEHKDYFFITDMHPRMIMHPYRNELTGLDLTDYTDSESQSGVPVFVEIVKLVKESQYGFLEYRWQWKDDPSITAPKMTYVEGVQEWGWIIGTGVYFEDVQQGIDRLEDTLYRVFLLITLGLAGIMSYVLAQSKVAEDRKKRAEMALHEAKDRYRALVESSNEGYILEADGKIVFSNNRLHQLLGYTDTELKSHSIWKDLFSDSPQNTEVLTHLLQLFNHAAEPGEFEAQIQTKSGKQIDIILSTSKIFLSEKLGHVISFRPIMRKIYGGSFGGVRGITNYQKLSANLVVEIENGSNHGQVVESLNQLPDLIREMIEAGTRPDYLRRLIGSTYDAAICRFIDLTIEDIGEPPVPFSFISFGSNARHDMTLFSDQDNAIVFDTPADADLKSIRRYFLHLAEKVCAMLNQAGYKYCDGLIMASNHQWCLSQREWEDNFTQWVVEATPENILELNVFFDIRATYGETRLVNGIQEHIQHLLREQPQFLFTYAKNCLSYEVPLSSSHEIKTEIYEGRESLNLKDCLRPMEIFCRLYALTHDIREINTMARLKALLALEEIDAKTFREMVYIFDHIWHLRFMNQIVEYTDLRKVNDVLAINDLTPLEQKNLENVLSRISLFHEKVKRDFFG